MTTYQSAADPIPTPQPAASRRSRSASTLRGTGDRRPAPGTAGGRFASDGWAPPEIHDLQNRYGTSLLDDFVLGHSTSDVLTELIQNEFDASGTRVDVALGGDALCVTGNGRVIDANGWKRLSLVGGTDEAAGPDGTVEAVPAKANSIGSKNFGLRSLFLFGDQIYVRSGGKQTIKDRFRGSPPRPLADPTSRGRAGISIHVPFRERRVGRLEPFTVEREGEMLEGLLDHLQYTVVKLAQAGSRRNLATVMVTSERCGRRIAWTQTARRVAVRTSGVTAVERTVRVQDPASERLGRGRVVLEEIEFQTALDRPELHRGVEIPGYFSAPGGRVRLGVSLRLQRGRVDLDHPGILYYPLGLRSELTGTAVSINAPFVLDQDRSRAIESDWNKWLLEEAADLTMNLLPVEWFGRFGVSAFLALKGLHTAAQPQHPQYVNRVGEHLRSDSCWPTRARSADGKPVLHSASQLVIPESSQIETFLSEGDGWEQRLVSGELGAPLQAFARECGAPSFGLNSLIRLRCAGERSEPLTTKVDGDKGEADYHYTDYESALRNLDRQIRFGVALDAVRPRLTAKHKLDLHNACATLAADGTLQVPSTLYRVDPSLGDACPVPPAGRLYPDLLRFKTIAGSCNPFDEAQWASNAAQRVKDGAAGAGEREALSRYVISRHAQVGRTVLTALRDAPILRDHRGAWVSPRDITPPRIPGARDLEPVLHFPHPDYAEDRDLESRLRFRRKLAGSDLIAMAQLVAEDPTRAEAFETILHRRRALLTRSVLAELRDIEFLRSSAGGLGAPRRLYLRNPVTLAAVGEQAAYVAGKRLDLYRTLGCSEHPRATDIIEHLSQLSQQGRAPDQPDVVYPALVAALQLDGASPAGYKTTAIIWTEHGYRSPDETLVGSRFPRYLAQAVPHVRAPERLVEALQALGAHAQPQAHHWGRFFAWIGQKYGVTAGPVTGEERSALRDAYRRRGSAGLPQEVGIDVRCLLARDRHLYPPADVAQARFVLNNDSVLADAITSQGAGLAFADTSEESREFFDTLKVLFLTDVIGPPKAKLGEERDAPIWFKSDEILAKLNSQDFASALAAIGHKHTRESSSTGILETSALSRRLAAIGQVVFVQHVELVYPVARTSVAVRREVWLEDDRISLVRVASRRDLDQLLALALAQLLTGTVREQQRLADSVYCLLSCHTSAEMATYLKRSGVPWEPQSNDVVDAAEEAAVDEPVLDHPGASETEALLTGLARRVLEQAATKRSSDEQTASQDAPAVPPQPPPAPKPAPLPPLERTTLQPLPASTSWMPHDRRAARSGGGGGWSPRPQPDPVRDEAVGLRGEELVYREERARVGRLGLDETRVIWTAQQDRTADHDIRSVDEEGADLWIEVKSTTGRDGRFEWSVAEFERAVREGKRYELWRVYGVNTVAPTYKRFRDPVSLLREGKIRIDIATFWAEVEPMSP